MTIERNSVVCSDALDLLRQLDDGSVDAVITDPPYGCGTQVSAWRSPDERFDEIEGVDAINADWLQDAYRVLKTGGAMYAFAKWVNMGEWQALINGAGFNVRNCIVWDKMQHGTGDLTGTYGPQHEMILYATKARHLLRGTRPTDVIRFPKVQPTDLIHPYEKPVGLLERLIRASSDSADVICDPFCGSGTTLVAAQRLGRDYLGCDINPEYVEMAKRRLAQPYTVPMFDRLELAE
jgi:site-specific DNA-methyltransferase (adenine-specific)